jgi:hypothetical protein
MAEVTVDAKPMAKLPYDPEVIPDAVKARAAAVDALYGSKVDALNSNGTPEQLTLPMDAPATQPPVPVQPTATPVAAAQPAVKDDNDQTWKHQTLTWQGRYNASQKTIAEMQEQMTQLGNELLHTQQMAARQQPGQQAPQEYPPPAYLTEKDVQDYGNDLLDVTQRAALHAVAPHLQNLEAQNRELQQRLAREARRGLDQAVELALPNYREIDRDPRWHQWLLGVDVFSGRVRQNLLDEAIAAASAPRVISFFRGFLREEQATGHLEPASLSQQPAAPREAAVPLASLAAPGRARPATGGDASVPPDRPIYTRAMIKQLYEQNRRGAYVGREAEWARQESDIIAAGREGRIR